MIGMHIIYAITGPMKSGKTNELKSIMSKVSYRTDLSSIFIKKEDKRNEEQFGKTILDEYNPFFIDFDDAIGIYEVCKDKDLIYVDEAQFLNNKMPEIFSYLTTKGKDIVVCGLDLDFKGEPFGVMPDFLSLAFNVNKHTAVCEYDSCNNLATRTQRLINNKPANYLDKIVKIQNESMLKDNENYEARCFKHHFVPGKPDFLSSFTGQSS